MKLVVTGADGQLGRALRRCAPDAIGLDLAALDITDAAAVESTLRALAPDVVINAAAYTAVDKAESERDAAFAVNATGAGNLARACRRLLHVSTDYVFDGTAPIYAEDAPVAPLGVYGESKAAGEREVHAAGGTVIRTSWLFEERGPSFVHTMLRLAQERDTLRVVADQHGCPTWADDLARALLVLAQRETLEATYHYCNDEPTTWHGFATAIIDEGRTHRALRCQRIEAITTAEYPTPARRPAHSVLDTTRIRAAGVACPSWRPGMKHVVATVLRG